MDNMKLNEHEQRVYSELFAHCDVENSGKVQGVRVSELFFSAGINKEILTQIFEICGAKRLGHFGRSQFYIALKLVAAVQTGLPVLMESINSGRELPLPKFGVHHDGDGRRPQAGYNNAQQSNDQDIQYDRVSQQTAQSGHLPPPPPPLNKHTRSHTAPGRTIAFEGHPLHIIPNQTIDHETRSPPFSPHETSPPPNMVLPPANAAVGAQAQPTTSGPVSPAPRQKLDSVGKQHTAPASVIAQGATRERQEAAGKMGKGWASFEDDNQGLITQEPKEWAYFTDGSAKNDTSSVSSDQESVDDVWSITEEQREYYTNQFKTMHSDVGGVISGAVAKEFFEKSKLPVHELSKIWHMSDMNRDGALSLDEFCTAMHLVVLRRNDIELPEHLPPSLMPYVPFANSEEPFAADLPPGSTLKRLSPTSPVNTSQHGWYCMQDSKIVHPVPLRMSPDSQPISMDEMTYDADCTDHPSPAADKSGVFTDALVDLSGSVTVSQSQLQQSQYNEYIPTSRPRPTPKKSQSVSGPHQDVMTGGGFLPPPPSSQDYNSVDRPTSLAVGPEGPPPPPRHSGHSRSSSIDKVLDQNDQGQGNLSAPPAVPPRPSPKDAAQGAEAQEELAYPLATSQRNQHKERSSSLDDMDSSTIKSSLRIMTKNEGMDKKDLQAAVRKQKEQNVILSRLNNELNQELQEVMEQRIALEIQLEHVRPFPS